MGLLLLGSHQRGVGALLLRLMLLLLWLVVLIHGIAAGMMRVLEYGRAHLVVAVERLLLRIRRRLWWRHLLLLGCCCGIQM